MSDLTGHVQDYLKIRRALGFKLKREGQVLPQLVAYLEAAGAQTLTAQLAISWARLPQEVAPINWAHRLGAARGFATYLKTIDPCTEVPARGVFPTRVARRNPHLWSQAEVCALLAAARQLQPPLRAVTHEALFGLIAVSGLRIGEAIGLARDDVDLTSGVLTIREAKFGHSRLVPLHPSTIDVLNSYAACRDRLCPKPRSRALFLSSVGTALLAGCVHRTFNQLTTVIGLRSTTMRPRVHDLRHSFAVRTLVQWHRSGVDVAGHMAVLSTYLGHVNPAGTYWYLSASPELMALAAARLDSRYGARR
jgi:integrase/recombinase XerD